MRALTIGFVLLLACSAAFAQVPHVLSYQGMLRDSAGTPVADDTYSVTFAIYDVSVGGTELWSETQSLPVSDGIVNAELGTVVALDLAFDADYWLGISVGGEAELAPRAYLTAAPYAIRATVADTVEGLGEIALPYEGSGSLAYNPLFKVTNDVSSGSAVYGRNSSTDRYGYLGGENYGVYGERYVESGATKGHLGGGSYGAYGELDAGFGIRHSGYLGGTDYAAYGQYDGFMGDSSEGGLGGQYGVYGHIEGIMGGVTWGYLAGVTYAVYGNGGGSAYAAGFDGDVVVTGTATIDDVLKLEPRAAFPTPAADGMLCVVGTAPDYHLYVYLNDSWRQLDPGGK